MKASTFVFQSYTFDLKAGEATFNYVIEAEKTYQFKETLKFPKPTNTDILQALLDSLFDNLHLILGISYWKLFALQTIRLENIQLTQDQASFWNTVYTKGLGEFFYKNKIDFRGLVQFPYKEGLEATSVHFSRKERSLLPFGGGKDSIVAAEMLKKNGKAFDLFTLNTSLIQQDVANIMDKTPIVFTRNIDPQLFDLNNQKGIYNGHIPISAIYSFTALLAAVLYDYADIVVSNEKSANYGNVNYLGQEINHQWSKSEEFEKLFKDYVATFITPDISYYSLLRKMTELEITGEFAKYPEYFSVFSSCNRNFKINKPFDYAQGYRWCGKCPKCAFVFTALSAYLPKDRVLQIFGKNLFEDKSLLPVFQELLGLKTVKPFECVGTPDEVKKAMELIKKKGEFTLPL